MCGAWRVKEKRGSDRESETNEESAGQRSEKSLFMCACVCVYKLRRGVVCDLCPVDFPH